MDNYNTTFNRIMSECFVSSSLNFENYSNRTDSELQDELKDLKSQAPDSFRSDISKKIKDLEKEIKSRRYKHK